MQEFLSVRDDRGQWRGRHVVATGAEHKCTLQRRSDSLSNTTDRAEQNDYLTVSDWSSFGKVPCLCEYHHLFHSGLIRNSLLWGHLCSVRLSVIVGVTTGKGINFVTWIPNSVNKCEFYILKSTSWLVSHLYKWTSSRLVSSFFPPIHIIKTTETVWEVSPTGKTQLLLPTMTQLCTECEAAG